MSKKVAIIGAGPAGLTAAYLLGKANQEVTVFEKDPVYVGGISRTETYKGYHFDIGGHRFFSKSKEVEDFWTEILANDLLERPRSSRSEVFVVEQNCVFLDTDNNDQKAYHTLGWMGEDLVATTRLFEKDIMYEGYQSIGRVVSSPAYRGKGIGKELMQYSLQECERLFGKGPIKIGAQLYLKKFYSEQGFEQAGDVYLEDDIDHIPMIRK